MNIPGAWRKLRERLQAAPNSATAAQGELVRERVTDAGYFEEVSLRYATAQLLCIMLLAVFAAVSLLTNSSLLSSENLLFFAKDMTTSLTQRESVARDTMVYTSDEDNRHVLFRDGLAVLGSDKLTVFTATGRESYFKYAAYATPRLCSSGRYLVAYDLGGRSYSLYNSFDCVESDTTDAPIRAVTAANNGSYCIVTDGVEYASRATLYNERFRAVAYYHLNEYTLCADLNEDGSRLLLASLSSQNGRMTTHLMLARPGKNTPDAEWTVADAYPVAASWTQSGKVMLLSTDFVAWYDQKGNELARHTFLPNDVRTFKTSDEGCVLVCRANAYDASVRLLAFDKDGDEVYNMIVEGSVSDVSLESGALSVLTGSELRLYRQNDAERYQAIPLKGKYQTLLAISEREYLLCGTAKTITVRFDASEEKNR